MRPEGNIAIVTGAGRGIGRPIAVGLGRESCAGVVNYCEKVLAMIPTRRIGNVTDIVGAAVFPVSPEAGYVTGATLYVDGELLLS